jgi:hypothetical protein
MVALFLSALAFAPTAGAEPYAVVKTLCAERYEENAARSGAARLVTGYVAPGLLQETGMGVYETASSVGLALGEKEFLPPQGGRVRLVHSLRIYGFKGAPSVLKSTVKALTRNFSVSVSSPRDGVVACRIEGDGTEGADLHVPVKSLPAEFALHLGDDGADDVKCLADMRAVPHGVANSGDRRNRREYRGK